MFDWETWIKDGEELKLRKVTSMTDGMLDSEGRWWNLEELRCEGWQPKQPGG